MIGKVVGSYKIIEKIGEGGMGAVYRAVDVMLEREAAIKAIRPDLAREPQIAERFHAEARTLARLHHPAIAMIYSFFHDGDDLYLAMEYVRGTSLSKVLRDGGRLPWETAVPLLASAFDGIEQAHRTGVVHRDLKPDNLMLTEAGTLKVMDFGIARVVGSSHLTRTGLLVGTLRYMAPEQIRGEEVDRRTDIYSLGTVLYEMVTGHTPFQGGSDYAILRAQIEDVPAPPSETVLGLPEWLDQAILKTLAKDPRERFQSVAELHTFLAQHAALSTAPLAAAPGAVAPTVVMPTPPPASEPTRPDRVAAGVGHAPTAATNPRSAPTGSGGSTALPVSPPPTGVGSYRPMGLPQSNGRNRLVAIAAVVLILVLGGLGVAFWMRGSQSGETATTAAAQPTVGGSALTQGAMPSPAPVSEVSTPTQTLAGTATPPTAQEARPSPQLQRTPSPAERYRPTPPPPVVSDRAESQEAETSTPQQQATTPELPAPASPSPEEVPVGPVRPLEEVRQLAEALPGKSSKLYDLYSDFLEKKEDGGAELTDTDEQLQEEIEVFGDAAAKLNRSFKEGFFVRMRGRRPGDRIEPARRNLAEHGRKVDALMAQVQPGPEVRQAWSEVRRDWVRIVEILDRRP